MADEPFALSTVPPELPAEAEYDAICAAVMATVRGRWFLQEYSRRNRNTDTRTVLAAIERIESVIEDEHAQQAQQHRRIELLEMAWAIAQTRAEVAELKPEPAAHAHDDEAASATASDVIAAAERLHDVAWTMREQGIDPSTSEQIEQLAATILSASSLRNPGDRRAQKLAEVLQYLERRIDLMLDTSMDRAPEQAEDMHAVDVAETGGENVGCDEAASEAEGDESDGEGDAVFSASNDAPADAAPVLQEDEPLQIELEPLIPAGGAAVNVESETGALDPAEPARIAAHADHGQSETTDFALDPPDLTPIDWAVDAPAVGVDSEVERVVIGVIETTAETRDSVAFDSAPADSTVSVAPAAAASQPALDGSEAVANHETPIEPEATVAAEVDSDLGFLAAPPDARAAPDGTEVTNEPQPASVAAASETSPDDGPAVHTAEAAASGEPAAALAPTMWGDSDPEPAWAAAGRGGAGPGLKPQPQPAASNDARASAQASAPLPADFLLDPLSPPSSESAALRSEAVPVSKATGGVADIEDELFAAQVAPETPVISAAPAPPATAAVTPPAPAPVAPMVVAPAVVVAAPVSAPPAQPAAAPAAAAPHPAAAPRPAARPMPRLAVNDPLAALHTMSDEERIALFT